MPSNHQDSSKNFNGLFHVSEEAGIELFEPRPSPSFFAEITADVVFAIEGRLLHNYLLPRDCPRVTYYQTDNTTAADKEKFFGESTADFVVIVESGWYERMKNTTLYCYELPGHSFTLLDECAGYHISYDAVAPTAIRPITDILVELLDRNVELRFTPSLTKIADAVSKSTLNFSIIRMRNAKR
ncbi:MAG TPA: hypothetical protein VFE53_23925 [Mucilaginibacter sp.]|jgi:hypothetical protein|nr:hypothetical protein [Mucilaginibacter sp.]